MGKEDIKRLLSSMSPKQIWYNLDEILESGVEIDELIELVGEPYPLYFVEHYKTLLQYGASPSLLANYLISRNGYLEEESYLFALAELCAKGATNADANKIIDSLTYKAYAYRDDESIREVKKMFYAVLKDVAEDNHLRKLKW